MIRTAIAVAAAVGLLLTGCASATPVHTASATSLTTTQAERLAITRFRNFDAGVRSIAMTVPGTTAGTLSLTGWYDFSASTGYAAVTASGQSAGLVWWDADTIGTRETAVTAAPLPAPTDGWTSGTLDPTSTTLAAALAVVTSLGSDRPDNPQLLQQTDAAHLSTGTIAGKKVDVFLGPSSDSATASPVASTLRARYWLDSTGIMYRFSAALGDSDERMTVDMRTVTGVTLPTTDPAGT